MGDDRSGLSDTSCVELARLSSRLRLALCIWSGNAPPCMRTHVVV